MTEMKLRSSEISCEHCIMTIRKAVGGVPGAEFVSGDPEAKAVVVRFDRPETLERLKAAMAAEGYPAEAA